MHQLKSRHIENEFWPNISERIKQGLSSFFKKMSYNYLEKRENKTNKILHKKQEFRPLSPKKNLDILRKTFL